MAGIVIPGQPDHVVQRGGARDRETRLTLATPAEAFLTDGLALRLANSAWDSPPKPAWMTLD